MPKTRVQKEEIVNRVAEKLGRSRSVVFADYLGLTMSDLNNLRDKLRETGAEFTVTKNNLIKIALQNNGLQVDTKVFQGPVATLFGYQDEIIPIRLLVKALKDAQKGKVKGGVLNGQTLDEHQVNKLAQLPSKEELRARVVADLGSPLYGIVGVLQANLRNFVYALEQIRAARGGE